MGLLDVMRQKANADRAAQGLPPLAADQKITAKANASAAMDVAGNTGVAKYVPKPIKKTLKYGVEHPDQVALAMVSGGALTGVAPALSAVPGATKAIGLAAAAKEKFGDLSDRAQSIVPQGVRDTARRLNGNKAITLANVAGGAKDALGNVIGYARDNPDNILAGANVVAGALSAREAGKLRDMALNRRRDEYAAKSGLRQKALAGLGSSTRASVSYTDPRNPYTR